VYCIKRKLTTLVLLTLTVFSFIRCAPDRPVTTIVTVDAEMKGALINPMLYGLCLEEINHAIDGGLYAELIQNRSFEDGLPPPNSYYDRGRQLLVTPNRWTIPFPDPNTIPGWRKLSDSTYIAIDNSYPINEKNPRSLAVYANVRNGIRAGVVAEGYKGISLKKGEKYDLSLYLRSPYSAMRTVYVALEDSTCGRKLSEPFELSAVTNWNHYSHTFTANEDTDHAVLTIYTEESMSFWIDMVSLFPQKTWKGRPNGLRADLMNAIAELKPSFIRFPGGSVVEGYTSDTYPVWHKSVGDISLRTPYWNVWGYGSSNGMGFHEYLQLCEDLGAEPIYVVNSGVTSQSRRPRYEPMAMMHILAQEAVDAIAYANEVQDTVFAAMRARNGHPAPFNLKYVEVGSENEGIEYKRRFDIIKKAINDKYPDITVISSSPVVTRNRGEWVDQHFHTGPDFFISNHSRFKQTQRVLFPPAIFIGEMSSQIVGDRDELGIAIGEACFYIAAESEPEVVKGLAYSPVLANVDYETVRQPMMYFDKKGIIKTPSYDLYKLFAANRGDEIYHTDVDTYSKPNVFTGRVAIEVFDDSYKITDAKIDNQLISTGEINRGDWGIDAGTLSPSVNRWNLLYMGDSTRYNYEFSATIQRTKSSDPISFRVRDNSLDGEQSNYIAFDVGGEYAHFYHQAGGVRDTLVASFKLPFENRREYKIRITCHEDVISCYIDDVLICEARLKPLPSIVAVATKDKQTNTMIIKVVNTTNHEETTRFVVNGMSLKNEFHVISLDGTESTHSVNVGMPMVYNCPPRSVSIIRVGLK
jgi:Alpha-L-arabinofuranosidase